MDQGQTARRPGRPLSHRVRPRILIVCARNSCRSPMALGFLNRLGRERVVARSGGLEPRRRIDPLAIHVMRERGIDITQLPSRPIDLAFARRANAIILLAGEAEHTGPLPFPEKVIRWHVEDPLGWPLDIYEDARDEIEGKVREFLACLDRPENDPSLVARRNGQPGWAVWDALHSHAAESRPTAIL